MPDALLVSSSFLPGRGGIESYLAELCLQMSPRLAVLAPARRDGKPLPDGLPYPVEGRDGHMLAPTPAIGRAIAAAAARHGTDRVLFGTPWPLALVGPALARRGLRYAAIVHGAEMLVPTAVPVVSRLLTRALAGAERLFVVSDYTGGRLRAVLQRHGRTVPRIERLGARVDLARFRPDAETGPAAERLGIPPDAAVVLCFGRLVRRKGAHRLLAAMPAVIHRVPHAVAVIAGTGPEERRLRRAAARTGVAPIFTGRVSEADAPALFARADVFALPVVDRWFGLEVEGLGVVLLEAAACGTPCITGRSGGTPEAVLDGVSGFVIDAGSEADLVDHVCLLLEDPDRARAMGRAGREHVASNSSAETSPAVLGGWLDQS